MMTGPSGKQSLFFGSPHDDGYSTSAGTVTTQTTAVPGVVLAVSAQRHASAINDQSAAKLFYI